MHDFLSASCANQKKKIYCNWKLDPFTMFSLTQHLQTKIISSNVTQAWMDLLACFLGEENRMTYRFHDNSFVNLFHCVSQTPFIRTHNE